MHRSDCSLRYHACEPSAFLESSSSKIRGSGWLRSASEPDGPVRRNTRAPRSRFVPGRCLGAKDGKLLNGQGLAASLRKLTSSNACASWILEVHSAPQHLSQLPPPSFDASFLLCSSEQGCDLDHRSMCGTPRIVGLVLCRDTSAVETALALALWP
jgi:hypothetical protein